jgi:hypothetical protein
LRQERETLAEVQTSSISRIIENLVKNERNLEKIVPDVASQSSSSI